MASDSNSERAQGLLTIRQAAEKLHISPSLVYVLCARRLLGHHRCGLGRGTIRISEKALEAYLQQTKVAGEGCREGSGAIKQGFKNLDGPRLVRAWKEQGAL